MTRPLRPNLPGVAFHLTARVQWQRPLLSGLEPVVTRAIAAEARNQRVEPVAHAIMSNHLHLIVVQGLSPLGWFMRSLLTRIARAVVKQHALTGHVFERRYFAKPCLDPRYTRTAFAYLHLNPVRAGVCAAPEAYEWTSHGRYSARGNNSADLSGLGGAAARTLRLFARAPGDDLLACALGYQHYLDWRLAADRLLAGRVGGGKADDAALEQDRDDEPGRPAFPEGDAHWIREFAPVAAGLADATDAQPPRRPEIRQLVLQVLAERAPDLSLDVLRGGGRTRPLVEVRREAIRRCVAAGHRNYRVARYLCVSPSAVSAAVAPPSV